MRRALGTLGCCLALLIPLLLTLGAGLATGIGSAIAFFARHTNKRLL